jgi:transposase
LFFSDYIYNIDPKFKKFNTTIGEMCNETRRAICKKQPSAEIDFDGEVHRKPVKTESTASSETSSTDSNSLQAFNKSDDNNEQLTESQLN